MRARHKRWAIPEMMENPYVVFQKEAMELRGKWGSFFEDEDLPLHLDLGTGRAQFVREYALLQPSLNVLGVEMLPNVLGYGARDLLDLELPNARLLCGNLDFAGDYFAPDEVASISINFCNPWPKARHQKRRLTHPRKLRLYEEFLVDGGALRLKTDDVNLYWATLRYLEDSSFVVMNVDEDLALVDDPYEVVTDYELRWRSEGKPIHLIEARNRKRARGEDELG